MTKLKADHLPSGWCLAPVSPMKVMIAEQRNQVSFIELFRTRYYT